MSGEPRNGVKRLIRGIRGATTVNENDETIILQATDELVHEMIRQNDIRPEDVVQVIITVTEDLTATFPAKCYERLKDGCMFLLCVCWKYRFLTV
jgi:chorismate mutase